MKRKHFKQVIALGLAMVTAVTMVFPTLGVKAEDSGTEYEYNFINENGEFTNHRYVIKDGYYGEVAYPNVYVTGQHTTDNGENITIQEVFNVEGSFRGYYVNTHYSELFDYLMRDYTDSEKLMYKDDGKTTFPAEIDTENKVIKVYNFTTELDEFGDLYLNKTTLNSEFNITDTSLEFIETKENEDYNPATISGKLLNVFKSSFTLETTDGTKFNIVDTIEMEYEKPEVNGFWESTDYEYLNEFRFTYEGEENGIEYGGIELDIDGGYGVYYGTYETDNKTYIDVETTGYNDSLGTSLNERFSIIELKIATLINGDNINNGAYVTEMILEDSNGTRYQLRKAGSVNFSFSGASYGEGTLDYNINLAEQDCLYQTEEGKVTAVKIEKGNKYIISFDLSNESGDFSNYTKTFTSYEKRKGLVIPDVVSVVATGEKTQANAFLYNINTDINNVLNQEAIDNINDLMAVGTKCEVIVTYGTEKITLEEKIGDYTIVSTIEPDYINSFGLEDSWLLYFNCTWDSQYQFRSYNGINNLIYHKIGTAYFKDYDTNEILFTQEYSTGTGVLEPETEPTKNGYSFIDWYMYEGEELCTFAFPITWIHNGEDIEVFAKWEKVESGTLYFEEIYPNEIMFTQEYEQNTYVIIPETAPTKEGHKFLYWVDALGGGEGFVYNTYYPGDTIYCSGSEERLWAVWSELGTLYFKDYNTDEVMFTQEYERYAYETIPKKVPTKEGYTFIGWYDTNDNKIENSIYCNNTEMTVYAKWEKLPPVIEPETEEETEEPTEETTEPETEEPTTEEETTTVPEPEEETTEPETETPEPETTEPETEEPETEEPTTEESTTEPPTEEETTVVPEPETEPSTEPQTEELTTEQETFETSENSTVEQVEIKSAMEVFKEVLKVMAIVFSIGLAGLLGILGILLLIMYWLRRVKVMNNINTDEYKEDDYKVVYKTTTRTEGSRIAELFKKSDRVWNILIPVQVMDELVTNDMRIVFNKSFCKRYNGEQLVVILQNNDNDNKEYGFVIDSEENEITFTVER